MIPPSWMVLHFNEDALQKFPLYICRNSMDKALVNSAAVGDVRKVAMLLSHGARVNAKDNGFTPLLVAAQRGYIGVCKLLLATGKANVKETTPDGGTPLLLAAQKGHTEVCELLLEKGKANIEEMGHDGTALMSAAIFGQSRTVKLLLSHGAKVDAKNRKEQK